MVSVRIVLTICTLAMFFCAGCGRDRRPITPDTTIPAVTTLKPQTIHADTAVRTTTLPVPPGSGPVSAVTTPAESGFFHPLPLESLPSTGNVSVMYGNDVISPYTLHPLPMENPDSTPRIVRIAEIEYSTKVYSSEDVEDFGYSHGQRLGYLTPGESNAVEGYIIYEVPASLTREKTYVRIVLPDKEEGSWVLR